MRVARFKVQAERGGAPFEGRDECTVEVRVNEDGSSGILTVRPKHGKKVFVRTIQEVARSVIQADSAQRAGFDPRPRRARR